MDLFIFEKCLIAFSKCKTKSPVMDSNNRDEHIKICYETLNLCLGYNKKNDTQRSDTIPHQSIGSTM